jgi:ABC-2 type transport system ATP-binding protein
MIIETHNLTKRFTRHDAVSGLSLNVPQGAAVALIGANGAGKTTTLRMLVNILRPDFGEARVLGVDSRSLGPDEFGRIGYVSENQKLPEGLTVAQFFDYLRPLYPNWDRDLEDEVRMRFELPADRKLGQLSHGMRIKACLASALPYRPALLVLDEPLSGLDALVRDEVMSGLLASAGETAILISSHELSEIEGCATHVAFMESGRLLFQDSMEALNSRFRDVTAGFDRDPDTTIQLPDAWMSPKWNGRTLRFSTGAWSGEDDLRRSIAPLLGPLVHLSAEPMNLRDISKALIRAHRREAV